MPCGPWALRLEWCISSVLSQSSTLYTVVALSNRLLPSAEFLRAYRALFGGQLNAGECLFTLTRLDVRALKQAYRRRAQATHPDRAHLRSAENLSGHDEFQAVVSAYELLKLVKERALRVDVLPTAPADFTAAVPPSAVPDPRRRPTARPEAKAAPVQAAKPGERPETRCSAAGSGSREQSGSQRQPGFGEHQGTRTGRTRESCGPADRSGIDDPRRAADSQGPVGNPATSRFSPQSDHYFDRAIPSRQLPFGQYLYYAGKISWRQLIDALVWQRQQRPPIGQLAKRWGMLTDWQVESVLESRKAAGRYDVRFADYAVELGYLSASNQAALLGRMNALQKPIGQYFVEAGVFEVSALAQLLTAHRRHNWRALQRRARAW